MKYNIITNLMHWLLDVEVIERDAKLIGCVRIYKTKQDFSASLERDLIEYIGRMFEQKKLYKILLENNIIIVLCEYNIIGHGLKNMVFCSERQIIKKGLNSVMIDCLYLAFVNKYAKQEKNISKYGADSRIKLVFRKYIRKYYISKLVGTSVNYAKNNLLSASSQVSAKIEDDKGR